MIPVTKPFLPPVEEYQEYLKGIWEREWLTNMGPLATELEEKLMNHLGVKNLLFVTNGTVALQMAIKALGKKGEIITTPFSFIATTSSIVWEGCTPVFADIDRNSLNIDPLEVEKKITDKTIAILATHVYGNPCDVEALQKIADKRGLKIIYDGAHAFGVNVGGNSVFNFGDISICSLHATKLYHSIEGGFIVAKDEEISKELKFSRNFGFNGPVEFANLGINGKNSEFHAAMGLVNLKHIQQISQKREVIVKEYDRLLSSADYKRPVWHSLSQNNYAYYPLIMKSEEQVLKTTEALARLEIGVRRYFYPSLAHVLPYLSPEDMPVTDDVAKNVICLPLYTDLTLTDVAIISKTINETL